MTVKNSANPAQHEKENSWKNCLFTRHYLNYTDYNGFGGASLLIVSIGYSMTPIIYYTYYIYQQVFTLIVILK